MSITHCFVYISGKSRDHSRQRQGRSGQDCDRRSQWSHYPPGPRDSFGARRHAVIPDILANAGGVTVSYFEWAQNIQRFNWEYDRVVKELEKIMRRAYRAVRSLAQEKNIDLRTAAFALAIQRVGRAAVSRSTMRFHDF